MRAFPKPVIIVSKCIEFAACRYNGLMISSDVVRKLKPYVEFQPICPEVEIGLGIPRDPIRIVADGDELRLIQPTTGLDITEKMKAFTTSFLKAVPHVDGWILKHRSPSCGIGDVKVYPGPGKSSATGKTSGLFSREVLEKFPHLPCEDEGRLTNFKIREHFLIKLFTFADFYQVQQSQSMKELVEFQSRNKLLLMAYHQTELRLLGRIVANPQKNAVADVMRDYEVHLWNAFLRPARSTANINVLMHALGYFSKQLTSREKAFFLDALEQYRNGKIPLSVPANLLRSWIIRFEEKYLLPQTFFSPYPDELMEISDSGKGRDLKK